MKSKTEVMQIKINSPIASIQNYQERSEEGIPL